MMMKQERICFSHPLTTVLPDNDEFLGYFYPVRPPKALFSAELAQQER